MAEVVLEGVTKVYPGDVKAVDNIDLTINDREFVVLVGPSGCGKSTTLRMVAGLEDITGGTIRIGQRVVNEVAPKDRNIAMVFQNYALYPHMSVYKNMAFGLMLRRQYGMWDNVFGMMFGGEKYKRAKAEREEIDRKVRDAATMLGIEPLLNRRPRALSGGQRQRVAVGRAIVRAPQAYLFDEPLSNLDAKLRVEMRAELKRLHRNVQTTTIYVTHDQEEAMTLGDRVVVMKDGIIHQVGSPFDVYQTPTNRFVASFVGTPPMNFLTGRIVKADGRLLFDEGTNQLALCAAHQAPMAAFVDQPVIMGVRPETFLPANGDGSGAVLRLRVDVVEPLGERMDVFAQTPDHDHIVCRIDARAGVQEGGEVRMSVQMERVHFFEPNDDGKNITLPAA